MTDGAATSGGSSNDYQVFALSVDDLSWTKHWLGDLRCDQLLVSIARKPDVNPKVWIRAVESKSASAVAAITVSPIVEPFKKGCEQIVATLDALWEIANPTALDPLIQELRFATFVEHLASVALSVLHPIKVADHDALNVLRVISDLSARHLGDDGLVLDGVVVCTQYQATVPLEVRLHELDGQDQPWKVYCVRAGAAELNTLLGDGATDLAEALANAAATATAAANSGASDEKVTGTPEPDDTSGGDDSPPPEDDGGDAPGPDVPPPTGPAAPVDRRETAPDRTTAAVVTPGGERTMMARLERPRV